MKKVIHKIQGIEIEFNKADENHPWDYYEGLDSWRGIFLTLAVPFGVSRKEIQEHYKKFKQQQQHDVTGLQVWRI